MTPKQAKADILDRIGDTRYHINQTSAEGAAQRGELGLLAQYIAGDTSLAGALDLAAFQALTRDAQCAAWQRASDADRLGLVIQILAAMPGRTDDDIPTYLDILETKFGSDQAIPPTADILALIKERYDTAVLHDDYAGARQLDRVRQNLLNGARLSWHLGDLLIQSVNNPGQVYSVSRRGCTCPNGRAGRASCWHVALYDLLLEMAEDRAAAADLLADAAAERAEQDDPDPATPAQLGARLADARRCYLAAA